MCVNTGCCVVVVVLPIISCWLCIPHIMYTILLIVLCVEVYAHIVSITFSVKFLEKRCPYINSSFMPV